MPEKRSVRVTISLRSSDHAVLTQVAADMGVSLSRLVGQAAESMVPMLRQGLEAAERAEGLAEPAERAAVLYGVIAQTQKHIAQATAEASDLQAELLAELARQVEDSRG